MNTRRGLCLIALTAALIAYTIGNVRFLRTLKHAHHMETV